MAQATGTGRPRESASVRPGESSSGYARARGSIAGFGRPDATRTDRPGEATSGYARERGGESGVASLDLEQLVRPGRAASGYADGDAVMAPSVVIETVGGIPFMIVCQSGFPVPAGTTTFLGRFDSLTEILVAQPCVLSTLTEIVILADAPPGLGESYTYTVRKILAGAITGADTTLTGVISGASQQETRLVAVPTISLANLDKIDVELVTSAGAAPVNHVAVPKFSFA